MILEQGVHSARSFALASVTRASGAGGIAYIARLTQAALRTLSEAETPTIELSPASYHKVRLIEKAQFCARLARLSLRKDVHNIFFDHGRLATAQLIVPARWRKPYAVFMYDEEAWEANMPSARDQAYRAARARVAISEFTKKRVLDSNPHFGTIDVCHPGLLNDQTVSPTTIPVSEREIAQVIIVARMDHLESHKGHEVLFRAWGIVSAEIPKAMLYVVGSGSDQARLAKLVSTLPYAGTIRFTGFLSEHEKRQLLLRSTVFVLPSAREGFGLVFLEAMRAGLPCVAGRLDASGETVVDGETGFLVDPTSPESVAGALITLLQNADLAAQMGEKGLRRFRDHYQFENFVGRFKRVIEGRFR
jgi:phosphatidyl-myo-inositol dimannoside synthase